MWRAILPIAVALASTACSEGGIEGGDGGGGGSGGGSPSNGSTTSSGPTSGPGPSGTGSGATTSGGGSGSSGNGSSGNGSSSNGSGSSTGVSANASVSASDASASASTSDVSASASTADASASSAESSASATAAATTVAASTGSGGDPFDDERQLCIDTINALRASAGLPAYARWTSGEICADGQATSDEQTNDPHGSFGECSEFGQNECLGAGPNGIVSCLNSMWSERNQAGCSGCDACNDAYDPDCPNCDFYGTDTGDVCGHYVNMSALYFDEAACGFSSLGGWDVINFR